MTENDQTLRTRFATAGQGFAERLALIRPTQWENATPCARWNVRDLVNHVTRGNLNYVLLLRGGSGEEFLRLRDADALGTDPVAAFGQSAAELLAACGEEGALDRVANYPLGQAPGRQLISIRLTDTIVHTWDLARAAGLDERLDPDLVGWVLASLAIIYRGIAESPVAADTTHRFFAAPPANAPARPTAQDELLRLMGRSPAAGTAGERSGNGWEQPM